MMKLIRYGFTNLLNFSGRDRAASFWPYVAFLFALIMVASLPLFILDFAQSNPGALYFSGVLILSACFVLLLASAVTRRLHDSNLNGMIGLLPLPFLGAAAYMMANDFAFISGKNAPETSEFFLTFALVMAYNASLILLIFLLARSSSKGENRYGPEPESIR